MILMPHTVFAIVGLGITVVIKDLFLLRMCWLRLWAGTRPVPCKASGMMDGVLSVFPVLENDYFSWITCVYQVK